MGTTSRYFDKKQILANRLKATTNDSEIKKICLNETHKYGIITPSGRVSRVKLERFIDKFATREEVKENIPVEDIKEQEISNINAYQLCIDISGSTCDISKEIEEGVNMFIDNLKQQDNNANINLLEFGSKVYEVNKNCDINKIPIYKHRSSDGDTCINAVIEKAINTAKKIQGQNTIVVFTDGCNNVHKPTLEETQSLIKNNKQIPIVFIGTGSDYAKRLGILDGYILTFETSKEDTKRAFNRLTESSKERIEKVKQGKDVSKDIFFKTKTELSEILKKSANIIMSICFEKVMNDERKKVNIDTAKKYMTNFISVSALKDKDYVELFNIMNSVEERVLTGKHDGTITAQGEYSFVEFKNAKTGKSESRKVNPNKILWIDFQGKRYERK